MQKNVHFIGIGGIGVSALARWFLSQKWAVSGSDLTKSGITQELAKEGVEVKIGHKKGRIKPYFRLVIYSNAIKKDNPEMAEARRFHIPILSYPEALGALTRDYFTIAVSGAHGKSTTTSLAALALVEAGLDPTVVVGTNLKELGGRNFRIGKSKFLVIEADEYKAAFLNYSPTLLIITNIDREHLEFYGTLGRIKKTFLKLISKVKENGELILNKDDKNLSDLRLKIQKIVRKNNLKICWYSLKDKNSVQKIKSVIKISGIHNISNSLAILALSQALKIPEEKTLAAIGKYRGAWRRMEYKGKFKIQKSKCKIEVYDDYAHHPTEIRATLQAFREKFPKSPIVCVFQPHQGIRLKLLFREFSEAFSDADILVLLPVYKVKGRDQSFAKFTAKTLAEKIIKKYPQKKVFYLQNPEKLKGFINGILPRSSASSPRKSAIVVMMGAGDIAKYTNRLLSLNNPAFRN